MSNGLRRREQGGWGEGKSGSWAEKGQDDGTIDNVAIAEAVEVGNAVADNLVDRPAVSNPAILCTHVQHDLGNPR